MEMGSCWEQILKALLIICGGEGYEVRTLDLCDFRFQFKIFKDEHPLVEVRMYDYVTSGLVAFFMEGEEKAKWQPLIIKLLIDLGYFPSVRSDESPGLAVFHPPAKNGIRFSEEIFLTYLLRPWQNPSICCDGAWVLGPGVFIAKLSHTGDHSHAIVFYYDTSVAKPRNSKLMDRTAQLLLTFVKGAYMIEDSDVVRVFWLVDDKCQIGTPGKAFNCATQFLVGIDGMEIKWLEAPRAIQLPK